MKGENPTMGSDLRNRMNRDTKSSALIRRMKKSMDTLKGKKSAIFKTDIDLEIFRPKSGEHVVDIIPYKAGKNDTFCDPGEETYTFSYKHHRIGPGGQDIICPSMYGKPCPACEYGNELYKNGDDESKKFYARTRHLYNIVCRSSSEEKAKGVQVWDVSSFYFEEKLLAIAKIPALDGEPEKIIDFADPKRGKSVKFKIVGAASKNDFDEYLGHGFIDRRYQIDKDVLREAKTLDELVVILSYNEIKKILDGVISTKSENEEESKKLDKEKLLEEVNGIDDIIDLDDFADDNGLELYGFEPIDTHLDFEAEKARLIDFLGGGKSRSESKDDDSANDGINVDELLQALKKVEDMADLEEFCYDNNLESLGFDDINEDELFKDELKRTEKFLKNLGKEEKSENSKKSKDDLLNELKTIDDPKQLKAFIKENLQGFKPDRKQPLNKQKFETKKFIKSMEEKGTTYFDTVERMNFEDLVEFVKGNDHLNHVLDIEYYDPEDIAELLLDIKQNWDDIPF